MGEREGCSYVRILGGRSSWPSDAPLVQILYTFE